MKKKLGVLFLLIAVLTAGTAFAACPSESAHRYGPWKTKTSATCTRQGHQFRYCQKCDHWEQRRTAKLPHTLDEMTVTKEPTCTEKGMEEAVCQVCNNTVRKSIAMLEHKFSEMAVTKEPTCVNPGTGEYTCVDCGKVKRETLPKLGHDYGEMTVTKEPTCTKTGTGEQACLRCGKVHTKKMDKIEHPWGEWNVTREPQGKRKGERTSTCTMCGRETTDYFYLEGTLYEGMAACQEVIDMQQKLKDLKVYKGTINSGKFGELTTDAVARFQKQVGMRGTGVADPQTLEALDAAWEKATGKTVVKTLDAQEMENAGEAQEIAE